MTHITGKSIRWEFDMATALVFLSDIDRFLGGGILISLKHILCIVASIKNFIPYNAEKKPIKATVGKIPEELERIRHYDVLDIQIENRILTDDYPLYSSLSILTVSSKLNPLFNYIQTQSSIQINWNNWKTVTLRLNFNLKLSPKLKNTYIFTSRLVINTYILFQLTKEIDTLNGYIRYMRTIGSMPKSSPKNRIDIIGWDKVRIHNKKVLAKY